MPVPRAGDSEQTPITEWSFEDFGSLNTKVSRPAVQDNEFFWNENWMPIATGRLRTMYAEGTSLFTGATIVSFKNPNWRSQMISMPEKTAVKRMLMAITPGAMNWM